jgi:hypothetical protein
MDLSPRELLIWDGPEGEVDEMIKHLSQYEIDQEIKYSKKGLADYIDFLVKSESPDSEDKTVKKLWKNQVSHKLKIVNFSTKASGS